MFKRKHKRLYFLPDWFHFMSLKAQIKFKKNRGKKKNQCFLDFDKKAVKESSSYALIGHLPLLAPHNTKFIQEKNNNKTSPPKVQGF